MKGMFEYSRGRFVNPQKIITANIYEKDEIDNSGQPTGLKVMRVALDLDVSDVKKGTVYSDIMPDYNAAKNFIFSVPVNENV